MPDLAEIIGRLEKATGPDRELDFLIHGHLHWPASNKWRVTCRTHQGAILWCLVRETTERSEYVIDDVLHYTASIDAALMLVPEGWTFTVWAGGNIKSGAELYQPQTGAETADDIATPAIALCIAALNARSRLSPPAQGG